jgi:hypothetical protein
MLAIEIQQNTGNQHLKEDNPVACLLPAVCYCQSTQSFKESDILNLTD